MLNAEQKEEDMVELFKAFGAEDGDGIITVAALNKALQDGGDVFKDKELNMISEELAGAEKLADGRSVDRTVYPFVLGLELELRQLRLRLDGGQGLLERSDVDSVDLFLHDSSPSSGRLCGLIPSSCLCPAVGQPPCQVRAEGSVCL